MTLKNLLEYRGFESGRRHFSWISSAESTKFVAVAHGVVEAVKTLGPTRREACTRDFQPMAGE